MKHPAIIKKTLRIKSTAKDQFKKSTTTGAFLLLWLMAALCQAEQPASAAISASELVRQLEARYGGGGFTARFEQVSTLKVMDITDTASGLAYFKEPGMMRWEYVKPEPQQIITDGKKIWIYKPLDNQVMIGEAPALLRDEHGVSFLAAVRSIKEKNQISLDQDRTGENAYALKLVPIQRTNEMGAIYLYVSKKNGLIEEIETINAYEDTTRIVFSDIHLDDSVDTSLFAFETPIDADVILLDTQE